MDGGGNVEVRKGKNVWKESFGKQSIAWGGD